MKESRLMTRFTSREMFSNVLIFILAPVFLCQVLSVGGHLRVHLCAGSSEH